MTQTKYSQQRYPQPEADETLVERVTQRDVAAFSSLYDRYSRAIYLLARYTLGSVDAEDVVQEVFLQLWRKADQYKAERGKFRPWFMAIARHHIFDRLRDQNEATVLMAVNQIQQVIDQATVVDTPLETAMTLREEGAQLLSALKRIPVEQQQALVLAYFGGLSQSAIAKHLGWPLGTVKKRTRLGLAKLRTLLSDKGLFMQPEPQATAEKILQDK